MLVRLVKVNKIYKLAEELKFQALVDINLEIEKGGFISIIGPSGSGKSTLMNIIGLLDQPTTGQYLLEDTDVSKLKEETLAGLRNKTIGFVFQSFNLLPRTKALDNVALPLVYSGIKQEQRLQKAKESLAKVGLQDKIDSKPNQLSGGQQQRVAIARALVTNPEIILADEPTGNLDSKSGKELLQIFQDLHSEGKTVILITHDLNIAKNAKRIISIEDGRILK